MTPEESKMLGDMLLLVVQRHNGQYDKGLLPYAFHPIEVRRLLLEKFPRSSANQQAIALGHDLIEDTKMSYEMLTNLGFPVAVIEGIKALTRVPGETEDEYLNKVIAAGIGPIQVKMCDTIHNTDMTRLKGITDKDKARQAKYMESFAKLNQARLKLLGFEKES